MADGRHSVTHYETLEAHRFAELLEVHLETGRTHQIRVHMAALKHPCVGDLTYGADPTLAKRVGLERQWLHAVQAGLRAPRHGRVRRVRVDVPRRPGRMPSRSSVMPTEERRTAAAGRHAGGPAAVAEVHLAARARAGPAMPPGVHPADDDARWVGGWDLATARCGWPRRTARSSATRGDARPGSTTSTSPPTPRARGVGRALLDLVKAQRPGGFGLWVFETNGPARGLLRPARARRAGAHRRLGQRGAVAGHPDGLAGHGPAGLLPRG